MGDPFYRGPYAYGGGGAFPAPSDGLVADVRYNSGFAEVVLPEWIPLSVESVVGSYAEVSGAGVVFHDVDTLLLEGRAVVLHNYGSYVVCGYAWDDDEPQEWARVQVNSSVPMLVVTRRVQLPVRQGSVLKLFISSNFEWSDFEWENAEVIFVTQ